MQVKFINNVNKRKYIKENSIKLFEKKNNKKITIEKHTVQCTE